MVSETSLTHRTAVHPAHAATRRVIALALAGALALQPVGAAFAQREPARLSDIRETSSPLLEREPLRLPDLGRIAEPRHPGAGAQDGRVGGAPDPGLGRLPRPDPEVNDYLNNLGQRLVAAVPDSNVDFEFFAVNDPSINAFALPGGFVGVNTGLILLIRSKHDKGEPSGR